jgi:hypothetical protein
MKASRSALIGAAAVAALLGSAAAGFAQTAPGHTPRMIEVPPGAVVLVLPAGTFAAPPTGAVEAMMPFPAMPSPAAMLREINAMMADAQRAFAMPVPMQGARTIDAAVPQGAGPVSGVFVTTVSDGRGTCTQRVVYSGSGTPQVQVSGNACAGPAQPTAAPEIKAPSKPAPRLLEVNNQPRKPPLVLAQANN